MTVYGTGPSDARANTRLPYVCIASYGTGCSPDETDVVVDQASPTTASGHNGVVFFTAKTRIQGDQSDVGGNALFWLTVNGVKVGSAGVRQLTQPNGDSTRTLSASYLATGSSALRPGPHVVQVHVKGVETSNGMSVTHDLPLMWFD